MGMGWIMMIVVGGLANWLVGRLTGLKLRKG